MTNIWSSSKTSTASDQRRQYFPMTDRHRPGPFPLCGPRCNEEKRSTEQLAFRDLIFLSSILRIFITISDRHKCVVGCCSKISRLGPRERAAILSATTSFSNVSDKPRLQWSDADLAVCDGHGARKKGFERRHGNAHHDNGSEHDGDHMRKPQDQPGESHDGACANNDVYHTVEQSDQFEERFWTNSR